MQIDAAMVPHCGQNSMRMWFPVGSKEIAERLGGHLTVRCSTKSRNSASSGTRLLMAALLFAAGLSGTSTPVLGQTGAPKETQSPSKNGNANGPTAERREAQEFSEAARVLKGAAGHPECVWLGRRIIALLLRDDLDTAFRHLELYERFGCPGGQI